MWGRHLDDSALGDAGAEADDGVGDGALLQVGAVADDSVVDLALHHLGRRQEARRRVDRRLRVVELKTRRLHRTHHTPTLSHTVIWYSWPTAVACNRKPCHNHATACLELEPLIRCMEVIRSYKHAMPADAEAEQHPVAAGVM